MNIEWRTPAAKHWRSWLLLSAIAGGSMAQAAEPGALMIQTHKVGVPAAVKVVRSSSDSFNSAQGPGPGAIGPGPGCDVFPAPANIGTKVSLSYFGPPPSSDNPSLVGPEQLLKSGTVDAANGTVTIPLYLGYMKGSHKNVWAP